MYIQMSKLKCNSTNDENKKKPRICHGMYGSDLSQSKEDLNT